MTRHARYPADLKAATDLGQRHFVMPGSNDDEYLWWHDCNGDRPVGGWGWFGRGQDGRESGHHIRSEDPLTVAGSLICTVCGDHGFIRDGKWVPA